jgi:predicted GTPase
MTLDDIVPTDVLTHASQIDIEKSTKNEKTIEPLRLLILGQVSSGKSSLINALFDDVKTAVSVLPTTAEITPYVLERDGLQQAIILDSAGYGGLTHDVMPESLKKEWAKIDIILMVCSAANAARNADIEQLNAIRSYFQQERQLSMPVIIAIATHIDRLRPINEWQPPYNVNETETLKAKNIRNFCEVIAGELHLPLENIVPVCLNPEIGVYNIDDGLMPMINEHLNEAQRVRYLRCLRHQQNQSYWQQWREQALGLGQMFFN